MFDVIPPSTAHKAAKDSSMPGGISIAPCAGRTVWRRDGNNDCSSR